METTAIAGSARLDPIVVNHVGLAHPWRWLALGWQDLRRAGWHSLAYGAGIVLISLLLTYTLSVEGLGFLVPFLAAGFYLLAPVIALGLYEMSARLERDEALEFCHAREAWRRNQSQLGIVTAGLLIVMQLWIAANFLLFAMLYTAMQPPLDRFVGAVLLAPEGRAFTIASVLLGLVLAWVSYAISAISIPLLMDRKIDGFTAIRTSVRAVVRNWPAMTLWAALIVLFVGLGLLTFYVGLAVAMPLLGHATWHAYRDLIPRDG